MNNFQKGITQMRRKFLLSRLLFIMTIVPGSGCDPFRSGSQSMRISVMRIDNSQPASNALIICAPENRNLHHHHAYCISQREYLSIISRKNSVLTDNKGNAKFNVSVGNTGFELHDTLTGDFYLFHISGVYDEVISTVVKPKTTSEGCHYKITVESIGKPVPYGSQK